jgi:nitrite reductase/ring-hydroxylating ferredoxin subunit
LRTEKDAHGQTLRLFGRPLTPVVPKSGSAGKPDWQQALPSQIDQTLRRVRQLPSGGWYVVAATASLSADPQFFYVDSHEIAVWKSRSKISALINRCPHMGAPLSEGTVQDDVLICPWHGLRIGEGEHGKFLECYDDGVLTWVRQSPSEDIDLPKLPVRPQRFIPGVIHFAARCDPEDIIANRLDPWHGVHLHPHSFARLKVIENVDDVLTVRVVFRAVGSLGVEVDCTFHCPEPNTIVMTIIDGEGTGSVVETHATPVTPGWTMVTEATLATSDRRVFLQALRRPAVVRAQIEKRAKKLWEEDRSYAERRYYLRHQELFPELTARSIAEPVGKRRPI